MIKSGTEPIPGFRLEELLGKGQFGEVWRARSPGNTYVAMKFLQLSGGHGWKEYRAIQRVKQIRHANLMPIIAIWLLDADGQVISDDVIDTIDTGIGDTGVADPSKATLVIEPVGKSQRPVQMVIETPLGDQTLRQRLADCQAQGHTGIPAEELLRYLEEAAKGLGFLNTARQVGDSHIAVQHCDVKPDNVMLMGGSAVVTDFGVAQSQSSLGSDLTATSLGGTPAYMAPECFKGKTSHATDQYALAVTYYELRTGELPFTERTYAAVYDAHRTGSLDFSAVPHREQSVLRHATSIEPDQRYESCSELVRELQAAVAGGTAARSAKKPRTSKVRGERVGKFLRVGLKFAAVAAIAVVLGFALSRSGGGDPLEVYRASLRNRNYAAAIAQVQTLGADGSLRTGLHELAVALGADQSWDDKTVEALLDLVASAENSPPASELRSDYALLRGHAASALDARLEALRQACNEWDPATAPAAMPPVISAQCDTLMKMIVGAVDENAGQPAPANSVSKERRSAFDLLAARLEARALPDPWPALQTSLANLNRWDLPPQDRPYLACLNFLAGAQEGQDWQRDAVEERLAEFLNVQSQLGDAPLAAWEQRQATASLRRLDGAIYGSQWLQDSNGTLADLVKQVGASLLPESYNAVTNVAESTLQTAQRARGAKQFDAARRSMQQLLQQPDLDAATRQRADDELLVLDFVDPQVSDEALRAKLTAVDPASLEATLAKWARVAARLRADYATGNPAVWGDGIHADRGALVDCLSLECRLAAGEPTAADAASTDWERAEAALESTPFADYGRYVSARRLSVAASAAPSSASAAWKLASQKAVAALAARQPGSLATAPFRQAALREVLLAAVEAWAAGNPPTDATLFLPGNFRDLAADAYGNLIAARALKQPPEPADDALLMAAAAASWTEIKPEHYSGLIAVSNTLLENHSTDEPVRGLLGTVNYVRARAQLALAADNPNADAVAPETLASLAGVLQHVYLDRRPVAETDAAIPLRQLRSLRSEVIRAGQPLADRLTADRWDFAAQPALGSALTTFYRGAGLLYREPGLAEDLNFDGENADDLVYKWLKKSHEILPPGAPHAEALIEQGRALLNLDLAEGDGIDELHALADQALAVATRAAAPGQHGRACSLKARAHLASASDPYRTLAQRRGDFDAAFGQAAEAETSLSAAGVRHTLDLAECRVDRANIHVQYAYWGELPFDRKVENLEAACVCAGQAAAVERWKNQDLAYVVWGNALEDLAWYYLQFKRPDGASSFELAGEKFQAAIRAYDGMPDVEYRHRATVLAQAGLLRCRNRWVLSGALPSVDDEIQVLRQGLADADELVAALPQEITDPRTAEPAFVRNACGLLYRYSQACQELKDRLATPDPALDAALLAKLTLAVDWAEQTKSAAWAQYQCDLAAKLAKNANETARKDARARARAVVEAHSAKSMPVGWSDLYTAITLVRMLDALLQSPWNNDAWAPYERLFPATDPEAAAYLAQLKLDRIGRAIPAEPALSEIADLLGPSGALDAPTNVKARAAWSFLSAKRAMTDKQYRAAFDQCQAALTTADRQLEVPVRKHLDDLAARSVAWADLPRWAQSRLANHLKSTLEQRYLLWLATTWLIKEQNLDRADLQYVKSQLEIARSSNLPTGVAFPAQMTAVAWDKSIDEAIKSLNAEMQRLAGS